MLELKFENHVDTPTPLIVPPRAPVPVARQYWLVHRVANGEEQLFELNCLQGQFWTAYAALGYNPEAGMDGEVVERQLLSAHRY